MRILALTAVLLVAGCSQDSLSAKMCEGIAKRLLRSPSTYDRTKMIDSGSTVFIEFDAANAYGTPVRNTVSCEFSNPSSAKSIEITKFTMNGDENPMLLESAKATLISLSAGL